MERKDDLIPIPLQQVPEIPCRQVPIDGKRVMSMPNLQQVPEIPCKQVHEC